MIEKINKELINFISRTFTKKEKESLLYSNHFVEDGQRDFNIYVVF